MGRKGQTVLVRGRVRRVGVVGRKGVLTAPSSPSRSRSKKLKETIEMITETSGGYTALLIRRDRSVRTLVSNTTRSAAVAAINENWQHRNHPENAHTYILLGGGSGAQSINPGAGAGATYAPQAPVKIPKRGAIAF